MYEIVTIRLKKAQSKYYTLFEHNWRRLHRIRDDYLQSLEKEVNGLGLAEEYS